MFKVLDKICQPTRATKYSAMVDLYARESVVIGAGETKIVPLGVKIDLENMRKSKKHTIMGMQILKDNLPYETRGMEEHMEDFKLSHYLELHPRSSLRAKGLIIGVGICDLDYPDEIGLIVHNPWAKINVSMTPYNKVFEIKKGDKIAQITLKEHKGYLLGIESDIERVGGFGSTDKAKL